MTKKNGEKEVSQVRQMKKDLQTILERTSRENEKGIVDNEGKKIWNKSQTTEEEEKKGEREDNFHLGNLRGNRYMREDKDGGKGCKNL